MVTIDINQLQLILPINKQIKEWFPCLNVLSLFEINTKLRLAAFFSQCSHESNQFTRLIENLNYSSYERLMFIFPKYFDTIEIAKQYVGHPEKIGNKVYAHRLGNGDEASGDGFKYRGRGIIQLTGKANYRAFGKFVGHSEEYVNNPEQLSLDKPTIFTAACWFWKTRNLNLLADQANIVGITKKINGALNGLFDRENEYKRILEILE